MKQRWSIEIMMPNRVKYWMNSNGQLDSDVLHRHSWWYKKDADAAMRQFKKMNARVFFNGRYIDLPKPKVISVP